MASAYQRWVRSGLSAVDEAELGLVDGLARRLALEIDRTADRIKTLHVHNAQSRVLQDHFAVLLRDEIGFGEEIVLTAQDGFVTQARPDFFYRISSDRGVVAEVERGGAVNNNHDLKDVWKAHIAPDAHHLFLIVPVSNWKSDGRPREKPFRRASQRIGAFFGDPRREIDVLSAHIFGY